MRHQEVDNYLMAILPTMRQLVKPKKGKLLDPAQLVTTCDKKVEEVLN